MEKQAILDAYFLIIERWMNETENLEAEQLLYHVARYLEKQVEKS